MASPIDFNKAATYARQFGDGTTYALDFEQNGQKYTFVPSNLAQNGGVTAGDNTYLLPYFTDAKNLENFSKTAQKTNLSNTGVANYLKSQGQSTQGFLIPTDQANFDGSVLTQPTSTLNGNLNGLKKVGDQIVYGVSGGHNARYLTSSGEVHDPYTTYTSILGDWFGDAGQSVADFINSPAGKLATIAAAYYGGSALADSMGGAAGATGGETAALTGELPAGSAFVAPEVGVGTQVASLDAGAGLGGTSAADLAAAGSSGGGIAATPGPGLELASTTGAPGLTAGGTSLAEMGGAQGLTIPGAAGGTLGAAGLTSGLSTPAAAGIGAGIGSSEAALGTGSALTGTSAAGSISALNGAAGGSTLSDILPYTTGASVLGSVLQADAAKSAADQQSAAAQAAIAQQQKNFETINAQQAPYRAAGYGALNQIAGLTSGQTPQYDANGNIIKDANGNPVMTTGSGYLQHQFDAADLAKGLAPNYDFMLQQGQMANQRAANMGGGALGGNALQGLNKYTQDYAGNAYQNAFNNYQTQRGNIYNTLAGIAGIGQTGQTATNTAATNATNAASQLGIGSAAAQAAGTVGSANAYGNALNNVTNQYTLAALLNQGGRIG